MKNIATITSPQRIVKYNKHTLIIPIDTVLDSIPVDLWTPIGRYFDTPTNPFVIGLVDAKYPGYRPVTRSDNMSDFIGSAKNNKIQTLCEINESVEPAYIYIDSMYVIFYGHIAIDIKKCMGELPENKYQAIISTEYLQGIDYHKINFVLAPMEFFDAIKNKQVVGPQYCLYCGI